MNEYVRAQELAVEGFPLDVIDTKQAARDKKKLTQDQINRTVEGRIDRYIAEHIMDEVKEVVEEKEEKKD